MYEHEKLNYIGKIKLKKLFKLSAIQNYYSCIMGCYLCVRNISYDKFAHKQFIELNILSMG